MSQLLSLYLLWAPFWPIQEPSKSYFITEEIYNNPNMTTAHIVRLPNECLTRHEQISLYGCSLYTSQHNISFQAGFCVDVF